MKKLFIFAMVLGVVFGAKAYSAEECEWGGDVASCTTFDPTTFTKSQTSCDTSKQAVADAKKSLCGDVQYYSDPACKEPAITPLGSTGGIWGSFKQHCNSDEGDQAKSGMCLYYDGGSDSYMWISSFQYTPPLRQFCKAGNIRCPKDNKKGNVETCLDVLRYNDLYNAAVADGRTLTSDDTEAVRLADKLGINLNDKMSEWIVEYCKVEVDNQEIGRIEKKWKKKYGGYSGGGVPEKKVRHKSDKNKEISQMSQTELDDLEDATGFADLDLTRSTGCEAACIKYWSVVDTIATKVGELVTEQDTLDSMCPSVIPGCDAACECAKANGHLVNNVCICKNVVADKVDECICTKSTPAGIWINGHCDHKGTGALPGYGNNNNGGGAEGSSGTDSTGSSDSSLSAGSGLSGLGGIAGGADGGSMWGHWRSNKPWYKQLADTFGLSTSASVGGPKAGSSGKGGNYGIAGTTGATSGKGVSTLGLGSSKDDLFTRVSITYNESYTKGVIAEPSGYQAPKGSSKEVKKLGTPPKSYNNLPKKI